MSNRELVALRAKYPKGAIVKLVKMNDVQAPPIGTKGVVNSVDDIGTVHVSWENGSTLGVCYGEDECIRIRECPICHKEYTGIPALSRKDNKTEICLGVLR